MASASERAQRVVARRRAKGLCTRCGLRPARPGRQTCTSARCTRSHSKNPRRRWTPEEDAIIQRMRGLTYGWAEIGVAVNRSRIAIMRHLAELTLRKKKGVARMPSAPPLTRETLIAQAASLASEHGENPEYDRALAELIYWAAGGESIPAVAGEIRALQLSALPHLRRS